MVLKKLKEVVNDQIVGSLLFHIQDRIIIVLKELCEPFCGETSFFFVKISDLLWEILIQYVVDLSLALRYIIEHQPVIAFKIKASMSVRFQMNFASSG